MARTNLHLPNLLHFRKYVVTMKCYLQDICKIAIIFSALFLPFSIENNVNIHCLRAQKEEVRISYFPSLSFFTKRKKKKEKENVAWR